MNIHHLELFYYVARHGGIVPAVRNMPYGIQQPAVSGQNRAAWKNLSVPNYLIVARSPSCLRAWSCTNSFGPSSTRLIMLARQFAAAWHSKLRVAAPRHCPARLSPGNFAARATKNFPPSGSLSMKRPAPKPNDSCRRAKIDLAVTVIEHKEKKRNSFTRFARITVNPINQDHAASHSRRRVCGGRDKIEGSVNYFSAQRSCHRFIFKLVCNNSAWNGFPESRLTLRALIECYVAHGYGIGLTVATPGFETPKRNSHTEVYRTFPKVIIGAAWDG